MYKNVFVSLKDDYIRIYTGYRTESWLIHHGKPVYLLPVNADESLIKESVLDCFFHSREINKSEEKDEYDIDSKDWLKLLKEKSWKSSYNSNICHISYKDCEGFTLVFTKYDKKSNSSPIVKEVKLNISIIDEIDIYYIKNTLHNL